MKTTTILLLFLSIATLGLAQEKEKRIDEFEMKKYFMVFLKKGEKRDQDTATVNKLQAQHMEHLTKMYKEGRMCLAGPFLDNEEIRGICVYNVATKEEAEKWANQDPAVKAGRLKVEVNTWYAAKDSKLP